MRIALEFFAVFLMVLGTLIGTFAKNYYVRLHFLGVSDTLGAVTLLTTLAVFSDHHFAYAFLSFLVLFQGPALTHLLARGAVNAKVKMEKERWTSRDS